MPGLKSTASILNILGVVMRKETEAQENVHQLCILGQASALLGFRSSGGADD